MTRMIAILTFAASVVALVDGQFAPLMQDNTAVLNVSGRADVAPTWGDSYSVGKFCYCETTFDHNIDKIVVMTPFGNRTVKEVCTLLGPGPGSSNRPKYNDIQCGHGPPNDAGDEVPCPGRIEYGQEGCKYIGPKWNFEGIQAPTAPVKPPTKSPVQAPFNAPVKPPTTSPVKPPATAPVQPPVGVSPVTPPVAPSSPSSVAKPPTKAPVKSPVATAPVTSPFAPLSPSNGTAPAPVIAPLPISPVPSAPTTASPAKPLLCRILPSLLARFFRRCA